MGATVTARAASLCQAQQVTARFGNPLRHIFTEIARGIDKWLWVVETSQQSGS
jgi:hypothetical protein